MTEGQNVGAREVAGVDTGPSPARVTATLVAGLASAAMPAFLTGALQGRMAAELGTGVAGIGVAVAIYFVIAGLASLPGGWIVDHIGAALAVRIGMVLATISGLTTAFAVNRYWHLVAALAIAGPAMALVDTAGSRAMSRRVPRHRQGVAFGTKEASMPLASLLSGLTLPFVAAQFGWRPAFVGAAVVALVTGLSVSSRLDAAREDATPAAPPRRRHEAPVSAASRAPRPPARPRRSTAPLLTLLALSAATTAAVSSSVATFLVPTIEDGGFSPEAAGFVLAGASLAAAGTRVAGGLAADRLAGSELLAAASLAGTGSLGVAGLALIGGPLASMQGSGVLLVAAAVLALAGGWATSGLLFLSGIRVEPRRPALSGGVVLAGLALGGSAGRALYGLGAEQLGFSVAWAIAAPILALAACVSLLLRSRIRRYEAAEAAARREHAD